MEHWDNKYKILESNSDNIFILIFTIFKSDLFVLYY